MSAARLQWSLDSRQKNLKGGDLSEIMHKQKPGCNSEDGVRPIWWCVRCVCGDQRQQGPHMGLSNIIRNKRIEL